MSDIRTDEEFRLLARIKGIKTYTARNPCHRGHFIHYVSNRKCVECAKLAVKEQFGTKTRLGFDEMRSYRIGNGELVER